MWSFKKINFFFRKIALLTSAIVLHSGISMSQSATKEDIIRKMEGLAQRYKEADRLSFDVTYRYATEQQPGKYIDSLQGSFKLSGSHYWYELDNTEFLRNDSIMLTVFKEDKLIAISGTPVAQSAMPVAILDSVLHMNRYSSVNTTRNKREEFIRIDFEPGFMYKNIQYVIDLETGFLNKVIATIRSIEMYDPVVKGMFENKNEFGILELVFTNYKTKAFDNTAFSSERYVQRSGNQLKTAKGYNGYRIYNSILKQ